MYASELSTDPAVVDKLQKAEVAMQQILARSTTDRAFRQQLLSDPRVALASFGGKEVDAVPETFNVVFIENKAGATIVLPDAVDPAAEISEAELEAVAGGTSPSCMSVIASLLAIYNALD